MTVQLIQDFEKKYKSNIKCNFNVGDTVRIHTKIIEGEKERIQIFTGIVVSLKGKGLSKTITIYRNAYGCSMERVFLLNSPRITKIEVEKKGKVKRSKLYYLRGQSGKKAKVQEQIIEKESEVEPLLETKEKVETKPVAQEIESEVKQETEETPKKVIKEEKLTEPKEKKKPKKAKKEE